MAVHTLGSGVDFQDTTKFSAERDGAQASFPRRRILIAMHSGAAKYSMSYPDVIVFRWKVLCKGATFNASLVNANLIKTALNDARLFNATGAGSQVNYTEQWFDQATADVYHVLDGEWNYENRIHIGVGKLEGILTLYVTQD
jgi:hypothetical protein